MCPVIKKVKNVVSDHSTANFNGYKMADELVIGGTSILYLDFHLQQSTLGFINRELRHTCF